MILAPEATTSGTLRIPEAQERDAGLYTCRAINELGDATAEIQLEVGRECTPLVPTGGLGRAWHMSYSFLESTLAPALTLSQSEGQELRARLGCLVSVRGLKHDCPWCWLPRPECPLQASFPHHVGFSQGCSAGGQHRETETEFKMEARTSLGARRVEGLYRSVSPGGKGLWDILTAPSPDPSCLD